jgi:antibiotic biosynthesis monooxygenase (ABM) superfamily enzyme
MWAQIIKSRVKPGKEEEARQLPREIEANMGDTGPKRIFVLQNQNDPSEHYTIVFFENEAKARENENSPEQAKRVERLREVYEQPEFVDLIVAYERQ